MKLAPLVCVLVLLSVSASAQTRDPVAGAWEQTASKNLTTNTANTLQSPPLHLIYLNGHYVQFTAAGDRKVITKPNEEQTKEELIDKLRMQGQYGTYQVKGTQLIRKVIAAAAPQNNGTEATLEFRVEGDMLITTSTNAQGTKTENRYRKLK